MARTGLLLNYAASLAMSCRKFDRRRNARLEHLQSRPQAERGERALDVVAALGEMRPAVAVNGNDHGVGECVRGLDRVVGIHGQVERAARLRGAAKQQHHSCAEAAPGPTSWSM
jgi:hypothetical protein